MKKESKIFIFFRALTRPQAQGIALTVTTVITIYMLSMVLHIYRPFETKSQLLSITPKKIKEWGGDPTVVKTGLFITNWNKFDVQNNDFSFDGIVWFQFDPALISLDTVDNFSFEKGKILNKSSADTKLIDGHLFAEYRIRLQFNTNLNHQLFPLDDHRIFIAMINNSVSPSEMVFQVGKSSFNEAEGVIIPDWKQIGYDIETGYEEQDIDIHDVRKINRTPKVIYSLDFRRSGISQIMLILLPIFLIFFVGLFSFAFDPSVAQMPIIIIATTALTSLVAYRFVIQRMSPNVGYFLLSDLLFTLFLAFAFLVFIIGVGVVKQKELSPTIVIVRGVLFFIFHLLVIISIWYFLFYWVK